MRTFLLMWLAIAPGAVLAQDALDLTVEPVAPYVTSAADQATFRVLKLPSQRAFNFETYLHRHPAAAYLDGWVRLPTENGIRAMQAHLAHGVNRHALGAQAKWYTPQNAAMQRLGRLFAYVDTPDAVLDRDFAWLLSFSILNPYHTGTLEERLGDQRHPTAYMLRTVQILYLDVKEIARTGYVLHHVIARVEPDVVEEIAGDVNKERARHGLDVTRKPYKTIE